MAREDPQMKIRLPAGLKDAIEQAAQRSGRTMNAEIVSMLQTAIEGLRLPEPILERLRSSAAANRRPLATELLHRVIDTFAAEDRRPGTLTPAGEWEGRVDRLMLQVDALHKWMLRQPEARDMEEDHEADPVHVGQVRDPAEGGGQLAIPDWMREHHEPVQLTPAPPYEKAQRRAGTQPVKPAKRK